MLSHIASAIMQGVLVGTAIIGLGWAIIDDTKLRRK